MTIGEKIRALRKQHGMTQTELAEKLNTTKQTIGKYEQGIVTNLPLYRIQEIADIFGVSPEYLTGWGDGKKTEAEEDDFPEARLIARAGKKMTPERKADMRRMLKMMFPEEFGDE